MSGPVPESPQESRPPGAQSVYQPWAAFAQSPRDSTEAPDTLPALAALALRRFRWRQLRHMELQARFQAGATRAGQTAGREGLCLISGMMRRLAMCGGDWDGLA